MNEKNSIFVFLLYISFKAENERERSTSCGERRVVKEGWCKKESGRTFLKASNWRERWFTLIQDDSALTLSYYKLVLDHCHKLRVLSQGKCCLNWKRLKCDTLNWEILDIPSSSTLVYFM